MRELKQLESTYPSLVNSKSPTQRPGSATKRHRATARAASDTQSANRAVSTSSTTSTEQHRVAMLSLDSCTEWKDVEAWQKRVERKITQAMKKESGITGKTKKEKKKKGKATATNTHENEDAAPKVGETEYHLELKYDGIAVSLLYEHGRLVRVATRGTGVEGELITDGARRWLTNLPESLHLSSSEAIKLGLTPEYASCPVEVRGEILMTRSAQHQYAEWVEKTGQGTAADILNKPARNIGAGLLLRDIEPEQSSSSATSPPLLTFVAYSMHIHHPQLQPITPYLIEPPTPPSTDASDSSSASSASSSSSASAITFPATQSDSIRLLQAIGAPTTVPGFNLTDGGLGVHRSLASLRQTLERWADLRSQLDFAIDGLVIKLNDLSRQRQAGSTAHHPLGMLAFKFAAKSTVTTVEGISWQVARAGRVTPVLLLKPVQLDGVEISRASMHNASVLAEMSLRIGDRVRIERRGDVIPYVVGKEVDDGSTRSNSNPPFDTPTHCPCSRQSCLECRPAITDPSRFDVYCIDEHCPTQSIARIEFYASREAMDIEGLGPQKAKQLIDAGFIADITDIGLLPSKRREILEAIAEGKLEKWGRKSLDKMLSNILRAHESATEVQLLIAVGIPRLGATQAKVLLEQFGGIERLTQTTEEQLAKAKGCGRRLAPSFVESFRSLRANVLPAWREQGLLQQAERNSGTTYHHSRGNSTNSNNDDGSNEGQQVDDEDEDEHHVKDLPWKDLHIILIGSFTKQHSRTAITTLIRELGGSFQRELKPSTTHAVVGPTSPKVSAEKIENATKAAREHGCVIMDVTQFMKEAEQATAAFLQQTKLKETQ